MNDHFDVIIAGCGTMGSAAAWYLAKKGLSVLALEKFPLTPHENGSHTGQSRIIRKAYFEHPDYVPLLELAYDEWQHWQSRTHQTLFVRNGLLYAGPPSHLMIRGVKRSSSRYHIEVNDLSEQSVAFPFTFPENFTVLFEPGGGFVLPERAIQTFSTHATNLGCQLHTGEEIIEWKPDGAGILVRTPKATYHTNKLVITAGAWTTRLLSTMRIPLKITRQFVLWVAIEDQLNYTPENFPCWMVGDTDHTGVYYGFPYLSGDRFPGPSGLKFAFHHPGIPCDPDNVDRNVSQEEIDRLKEGLLKYFPAAGNKVVAMKTCLYSNTPDENFIIDHLPENDKVIIACGFSGHGFKFAPAIGKVIAQMVTKQPLSLKLDFLRLNRFLK